MSQIFLYLPTGHLISEKLLYLLKFQKQQRIEVKFFKPLHNKNPTFFIENFNLENLSIDRIKFENIKNKKLSYIDNIITNNKSSFCSENSLDISQDSIEFSEFKKNRTINKKLSKMRLKNQSLGSKGNLNLKIDHPTLVIDQQIISSNFVDIVVYLLKNFEFVKKIQTNVDQKFLNHLNFIQIFFDQVLEFLMSFIYNLDSSINKIHKKLFHKILKIFYENLTYFENYFLEEDSYLFNYKFSFIDLSMLAILNKSFKFLLGQKIRKNTFPNLLIWFKKQNFYFNEELNEFNLTQFCSISYCEQFFICDKQIFEIKENQHNENWTFKLFKQELSNLLKRRNYVISQNSIFKLSSQQFSVWKFEFILTETDQDENQFKKNNREIIQFQQRFQKSTDSMRQELCIYQILYSQCEEETYYFQTEEMSEMCSVHSGRYFKNLNLCGILFYQGQQLPQQILKYESADEIHLEQIRSPIDNLFQQIFRKEKNFAFEKIFKEIII